ncbi:hypothetical protein [Providencia phage PSTCR3]|nr:hypothetical protein [Providencia phage PSTCR3]
MKIDLWITILLAIPLSIAGNILTPKITAWYEKYSNKSKKIKLEKSRSRKIDQLDKLRKERDKITDYHDNPHYFNQLLLVTIIKISLLAAMAVMYGVIISLMDKTTSIPEPLLTFVSILLALVIMLSCLSIMKLCNDALNIHKKIKNFHSYDTNITQAIKKLTSDTDSESK